MFIRQNFHSQRLIDESLSSIIYSQTYIYIYSYPTTIQIEVEASGFGAKKEEREKEGGRYPWKTLAQKQEHRVPAIRIIASRDRGI